MSPAFGAEAASVSFIVVHAIVYMYIALLRSAPTEIQMMAILPDPVRLPGSASLSASAIVGEYGGRLLSHGGGGRPDNFSATPTRKEAEVAQRFY